MYGLSTINAINAARAGAEAKAKLDMTPPLVPRQQRKLGWFTDLALKNLTAELRALPKGTPARPGVRKGGSVADLLAACERELDYRRREDRIIQAATKA